MDRIDALEEIAVCASVVREIALEAASSRVGAIRRAFMTEDIREAGRELNAIMTRVCAAPGTIREAR